MEVEAEEIFKEFKQHSISEFFKKNRQMLGYSGMVRSLVTVVHEYVTNSLDACEEAGILPDISVGITETGENRYSVKVSDNGPGIPKEYVGRALATILAGTKFHRYVQQRGQQGIGAAGCTLFSQITTGKPIQVKTFPRGKKRAYSCSIALDTMNNKPIVTDYAETDEAFNGLEITGEFGGVKYEKGERGVYEYLRRTALSNPHIQMKFVGPDGEEKIFVRAVDTVPERPKPTRPHPLGLAVNDLIEFAKASKSRKLSVFLMETFSRVSQGKVEELRKIAKEVDLEKPPDKITWEDSERLIKAFKEVRWISPDPTSMVTIGEDQIGVALKNILAPEFMHITARKPAIFRGGIPFVVEAAVAFGGYAGRKVDEGYEGNIMRFANRVPLMFDSGSCAITEAVKGIQWKRYGVDMDSQPITVFVNVSSVHIPYSGVGKESISPEEEIVNEIKLAVMESARGVQRYVSGKKMANSETSRYKMVMGYANQLASDLSTLTKVDREKIKGMLEVLVSKHYPKAKGSREEEVGEAKEEEG